MGNKLGYEEGQHGEDITIDSFSLKDSVAIYSLEQIAEHNRASDLWLIIDDKVYDVSKYTGKHPGGFMILLDQAGPGKDASDAWFQQYHSRTARNKL